MWVSPLRLRRMVAKELRQMLRDPRMRLILFVAPIIQLLIFGYAVNTDVRRTATYVVDHDQTALSRQLVGTMTAAGFFRIVGRSERSGDIARALDRGRAIIGLDIPPGFAADVRAGRGAKVQLLVDGTDANTANVALGYASAIIRQFALRDVGGATPTSVVDLRSRAWYNPGLESRMYNVPAVIGALLLLICLLLTALAVVREREIGTLDQLLVSPLRPSELMLGKTIPVAIVGMADLVLVSAVAIGWFGIPMRGTFVALALAALLYILAGLSIGLLISTISNTQQEAFMSLFLFLLPAIILSGFMFPVTSMPVPVQWLTIVNPMRHFLEVVRAIFLKGATPVDLWPQYAALTALAAAGISTSTLRFRQSVGR